MKVRPRAVALAALALTAAPALAETVAFDNSDLTFRQTPKLSYSVQAAPAFDLFNETALFVMSSPAANAAGTGVGPSMDLITQRQNFTSSQWAFDMFTGAGIELALVFNYNNDGVGNYQPLVQFGDGESVDASDFPAPFPGFVEAHGPIAAKQGVSGSIAATTPVLGEEAYIGIRIAEGSDYRYAFVRLTWFEGVSFPLSPEAEASGLFASPGHPNPFNAYLPTAWGYETELNTPVLIQIPAPATALIPALAALALARRRRA